MSVDISGKSIAEGSSLESLEETLQQLPQGDYNVIVVLDDGSQYLLEVETNPEATEGVGIAPLLFAVLGVFGLIVGWKVYQAITKIPDWVWVVGGLSVAVLLFQPVIRMVFPEKAVVSKVAGSVA